MDPIRSILVVEDDDEIRDAITDALCFEGLSVHSVANGREAVELLQQRAAVFGVVLLDLMMPVMDGKEFLKVRARDPALARVPVIILTAGGDCREVKAKHDIARCLHKPILMPDLLAAISAV